MGKWFGKRPTPQVDKPAERQLPRLSVSAQLVLRAFNELPEANRPAFDIVPMLQALDIKYGRDRATDHMTYEVWDDFFAEQERVRWRSDFDECSCRASYDYEGWLDPRDVEDVDCRMPEYAALMQEIEAVQEALLEQEHAQRMHERAVELAGIAVTLRSVEDLTAALRAERRIVDEVTEMLAAPLAPKELAHG